MTDREILEDPELALAAEAGSAAAFSGAGARANPNDPQEASWHAWRLGYLRSLRGRTAHVRWTGSRGALCPRRILVA